MNKYYLSWRKYLNLCYKLVELVKKDKNKFHYIIGLNRGGLIPALILSHSLKKKLFIISPHLIFQSQPQIKLLIVDDLVDKGNTLSPFTSKNYKTAVLFKKPWSKVEPDYYVKTTTKWIIHPYETKN